MVGDGGARYFGVALDERSLVPGANPRLGPTTFDDVVRDVRAEGVNR